MEVTWAAYFDWLVTVRLALLGFSTLLLAASITHIVQQRRHTAA